MANLDGGHYFLSTLIPLHTGPVQRRDGSFTTPSHVLREALASLPTAQQSPVSVAAGFSSPFSRCRRTHFARAVLIDQPMYNGRDGGNALLQALRKTNLLQAEPVDHLRCPYLMFNAEFDARPDEADAGLSSWAAGLWAQAELELRDIFSACRGFDAVDDGPAFAAWLQRCQVDTTMSFNDYYEPMPDLHGYTLAGVGRGIALATAALALLVLGAILLCQASWWWLLPGLLLALVLSLGGAALALWRKGSRPFPAGDGTDLPSVLKALHVQQHFALLAAQLQGADAATVHRRFGEFVQRLQPGQVEAPTQAPGVIRSDGVPLVDHQPVQPLQPNAEAA